MNSKLEGYENQNFTLVAKSICLFVHIFGVCINDILDGYRVKSKQRKMYLRT